MITISELESRLRVHLGQPVPARSVVDSHSVRGNAQLTRLREALQLLKKDAERVGQVPCGYPRHLDLIMKAISALLPWYTRTIAQFAKRTTEALEIALGVVGEIAAEQTDRGWPRQGKRAQPLFSPAERQTDESSHTA